MSQAAPDIRAIHRDLSLTGVVVGDQQLSGINGLTERDAMALPPRLQRSSLDDVSARVEHLRARTTDALVDIAEGAEQPLQDRYAAAQLLGVRGDPRINTREPEMLQVPGATVMLGLPEEQIDDVVREYAHYGVLREWIAKESPAYQAEIRRFRLAKYCVTHQEYRDFLEDTGHNGFPTAWEFGVYRNELANHPVHAVDAGDADLYCAWLSEKTGRAFRLPTEAEWEYAAGGGLGLEFPWGNRFEPDHANTVESGILRSTPVGIFPRGVGRFGHMDLAGNVEEYVSDVYRPYGNAELIKDDLMEKEGDYRIARGGSFTRFRDLARTRRRHGRYNSRLYVMGFRLAETVAD